jgi:palmitoyl-protein thioesterase
VVLWHGLGDSCCASHSIGYVANLISDSLGVYVHSIATGDGTIADVSSTFFGNVNDQVAKVCEELADMPELKGGFNAIGFSQGGQFMRAVVERCQGTEANGRPRMHTLVTMGGQHQGIYNLPNCQTDEDDPRDKPTAMCLTVQRLVAAGAYLPFIRDQLIQAQYFKDPFRMDDYLASNIFLPDINNEREVKNATYADNLASLERLVLYRFEKEYTVVPRGSEWFDFFDGTRLVNMSDTDLYKEDWIGLRRLDEAGGVFRGQVDDSLHMQFTDAWFTENVIDKFLRGHAE